MRPKRRTLIGLAGLAATVLLHMLLVAVAVWGGGRSSRDPRPPDAIGAGANTGEDEGEPGERRITVMLTPVVRDAVPLEPAPQLPVPEMQKPSMLEITGIDSLPLPPIEMDLLSEQAADQDAELMARARFAGIYESQLRARIERAWELPQDQALDPEFSCLVQIHQRRNGRVSEVDLVLDQCKGSPAMQTSLARAIQAASPLPAPPHPSAFVENFSMVFHARAVIAPERVAQRQ
jgi:hypothetical protein